jgi:hypothetical protein
MTRRSPNVWYVGDTYHGYRVTAVEPNGFRIETECSWIGPTLIPWRTTPR